MSTLTPTTSKRTTCASGQDKLASRGPADELLDPERRKIIAELSVYIGHVKLPSTGWALLWFTDLAILRKYLKICQESKIPMDVACKYTQSDTLKEIIMSWKCRSRGSLASQEGAEEQDIERTPKKRQRTSETASRIPTLAGNTRPAAVGPQETTKQPAGRSESAKKLCKERDQNACLLTGYSEPLEVAHIFPYSLGQKKTELEIFWGILRMYWSGEKIDKWREQVLGPNGTETCSNLMCMSNLAHKLWETARFALNPLSISEDQKVMKVKFYWMPINKFSDNMPSRIVPTPFPDGRVSSIVVKGRPNAKLFNINTDIALRSGDVLTFKTDDPVGHPLPSMELLSMQWALHRVLALSGAADATDEELDPPDPDWLQVEATDEDVEEEVESKTEEEDPEEESWDKMVVEGPQFRGHANPPTGERSPGRENRPASTLPRSKHVDHKDEGRGLGQEQADAESSPALGFRDTNIH
ncbi:hypothetical protein AtubIFM55763_011054 [Aspergillus tubingensis]|nr:hypothetical protein AtubIFM54640_002238 [Aspergillus tubingensis]GLA78326.1 hypothetical protein AtubIFM55763_011054 [Aspergillus tubingensis]